jgi:hypothetical protein
MTSLATRFARTRTEFRSNEPLTTEQIHRYAPSILATQAHDSRSARYSYIPTSFVLQGLKQEGFEPFFVAQSKSRLEDRREFTKHMLRLRHRTQIENREETQEIILINSHDGSSAYQLLAGSFRFACANGLIVGKETADIRIPHKGAVRDRVIEGAFSVVKHFEEVASGIDAMKAETLSDAEQVAMATAALELRYDEGKAVIPASRLLEVNRREDLGNDLWTVFNRVQENVLRGGQTQYHAERRRTVTTRAIKGIDQGVKLNRALWVLAEEMRKLKRAA